MNTSGSTSNVSGSTAGPVAGTRTSKRGGRRPGAGRKRGYARSDQQLLSHVAVMSAQGLTKGTISKALSIEMGKLNYLLSLPETQIEIQRCREIVKQVASSALPTLIAKGFALAEGAADERDAKSFDAATRGLAALEKISSSASGEDRRVAVEHSGSVDTGTANLTAIEQLNILIQGALSGHPRLPLAP